MTEMGILLYLHKRRVRGIVRAMWKHYGQGKHMTPGRDDAEICRDVIGSRYQVISPDLKKFRIIRAGIERVRNLYDAAFLVVAAETQLDPQQDYDLFRTCLEECVQEVGRLNGIGNPSDDLVGLKSQLAWLNDYTTVLQNAEAQNEQELQAHLNFVRANKK